MAISARCRFIASVLHAGRTARSLALAGADRAEDIGGSGALIVRRRGPVPRRVQRPPSQPAQASGVIVPTKV